MKTNFLKVSILALVTSLSVSCSSDDSQTFTETVSQETTQTNTWVKLTASTAAGVNKQGYIIMMFEEPVTAANALPPIKKQVTTDANGLAYFDLNSMVTSSEEKTYYFEAFTENGSNLVWKSVSHPSFSLKKGTMSTSSIIVN